MPRSASAPEPAGADVATIGRANAPEPDWAEKYRPRTLGDVVGNGKAVATMRAWAEAWLEGTPEVRALVLEGTPGIGKTTSAHALARDMGWDVIELNASDSRSAPIIQRVAGTGSVTNTFSPDGSFVKHSEGRRTLIILDEADNLYERGGGGARSGGEDLSDRGGKAAIIKTIRETRQPIILIVNDYYGLTKGTGAALRSLAEQVRFQRPQARSIAKRLSEICQNEGVRAHPDALVQLAEEASGDLRAAVNDLQAAAQGREVITTEDVRGLGHRDTGRSVFDAMPDIFKTMDLAKARIATRDVDENPESMILWVDENLPIEYKDPDDLARGYDRLSKADVYLGRVRRRQYYGLWSYANDMMTGGVALAKKRPYKGWTRWQFPGWLRRMSASRASRNLRDGLAQKVARLTHTSRREARSESLEPLSMLFANDEEFAVSVGADLDITPEEIAFLLNTKPTTKKVQTLHELVKEELERRPRATVAFWTGGTDDGDDGEDADDADDKPARKKAAKRAAKPAPDEDEDDEGHDEDKEDDPALAEAPEDASARPQPKEGQKGLFDF